MSLLRYGAVAVVLVGCASPPSNNLWDIDGDGGGGAAAAGGGGDSVGEGGAFTWPTAGAGGQGGTASTGGTGGRSTFFGDSRCASAEFLFCDGFESDNIDAATWATVTSKGTVVFDQVHAARGSSALHATASAVESHAWLRHKALFPLPDNALFVRMFVYAAAPLPAFNWNYLRVRGGTGDRWQLGGKTAPFGEPDGDRVVRLMHLPLHVPLASEVAFPTESWTCWEMQFDGTQEVVNIWIDEQPVETMSVPNARKQAAWVFPNITSLWVGIQHSHDEAVGADVWIDEVAIHDSRIGCEN